VRHAAIASGENDSLQQITAPEWPRAGSFYITWDVFSRMAASGLELKRAAPAGAGCSPGWDPDVEPGSEREQRMLLACQFVVASSTLRRLASAQLVLIDPAQVERWGMRALCPDPLAFSRQITMPDVYIDLMSPTRSRALSFRSGGRDWRLGGALVWRDRELLHIVPAGSAPPPDNGPLGAPLGHIIYGPDADLPRPRPGQAVISQLTGQITAPLVRNDESMLNQRMQAAVTAAANTLGVMKVLADDPDVELYPDYGDDIPRPGRRAPAPTLRVRSLKAP
jgi:hypothetical protein